jgi:hypothetical protein
LFPFVLANSNTQPDPAHPNVKLVPLRYPPDDGYQVFMGDLVDRVAPWRHDSHKLAHQILRFHDSQRASS